MNTVSMAVIQMTSTPRVADNLTIAEALLRKAARQGARLACLPENFALMGAETDKLAVMEEDGAGPIQDWLARMAGELGLWLVGGSIPLRAADGSRCRAACMVFDDRGQRQARYDKVHLFDVDLGGGESYRESRTIEPGHEPVLAETPWGRLGLSICYDLRFPELYRRYAGAELLVVPSAFTETTGRAHWDVLVRTRAIENLAYVLAPNQGGRHENGRATFGGSQVVDPWGRVLGRLDKGPGVVLAEFDPRRLAEARTALPSLGHRRLT